MNAMYVIHPYRTLEGSWVFDDESRGLVREPFVFGIPEMIEAFTADIPRAADGFVLLFSRQPFPGFSAQLAWEREEYEGNWYRLAGTDQSGWLCPALLKYFDDAPPDIYCRVEAARAGSAMEKVG